MTSIEKLLQAAEAREAEARALRLAASILTNGATAAAAEALPGKLRKAARLRAEAPTPAHPKGAIFPVLADMFRTTRHVRETAFLAGIKAQGFAGQGVGNLYRLGYLVLDKRGFVALTAKGRVRVGTPARQRRKSAKASTNGKGGSAAAYVAELVKANGAPMRGPDIVARAKANGRSIYPQTIGRATRHGLIVAIGTKGTASRMFQAPA